MFKRKEIIKEVKIVDETRIKELEQELKQTKINYESEKKILENELQVKIDKKTKQQKEENNELQLKNSVLQEKVNILEKAFENMGFDIKDMKEILNKLVDGIVSKNNINIVK